MSEEQPCRTIIIGILGGQDLWGDVAKEIEPVCRYMLMPFSPDETDNDREIFGNICEYSLTLSEMRADEDEKGIIKGEPSVVFCVPGIDRRRRMRILTEAIPEVMEEANHELHELFLYYEDSMNEDALFAPIIEARAKGFAAKEISSPKDAREKTAEWLVGLDPQQ
jgi:hypothetical protein